MQSEQNKNFIPLNSNVTKARSREATPPLHPRKIFPFPVLEPASTKWGLPPL